MQYINQKVINLLNTYHNLRAVFWLWVAWKVPVECLSAVPHDSASEGLQVGPTQAYRKKRKKESLLSILTPNSRISSKLRRFCVKCAH